MSQGVATRLNLQMKRGGCVEAVMPGMFIPADTMSACASGAMVLLVAYEWCVPGAGCCGTSGGSC